MTILMYDNPRRFGFVKWVEDFPTHPTLRQLGLEPLSRPFSGIYLYSVFKKTSEL